MYFMREYSRDQIDCKRSSIHYVQINFCTILQTSQNNVLMLFSGRRYRWQKKGKFLPSVCGLIGLQKT